MSTQDKKEVTAVTAVPIPEEITKVIKIEVLEELKKISAIPPSSGSNVNYEEYKKKILQQENLKK